MDVDTRLLARHAWPVLGAVLLAVLLGACQSGGGTPRPAGVSTTSVSPAAADAGPVKRVLQAMGLARSNPPAPAPHDIALRIFTAQNLNAGPTGQALAAVVNVYHLRSLDRFRQMPFNEFLDRKTAAAELGHDLIDSREMLVLPDQRYTSTEHLPLGARYVGVVALFRGPAPRRWRFAYEASQSQATGITLGVHACAMTSTAGALVTVLPDDPASLASVHCSNPGS